MKDEILLEVRYYDGEESSHEVGFGIAPSNLYSTLSKVRKEYYENKIGKDAYFVSRCVVKLRNTEPFSGDLVMRIIGETIGDLKKCAKNFKMPFDKKFVFKYVPE